MVAVKRMSYNAPEEMLYQMQKESTILLRVSKDPNVVQFFGTCLCNPPQIVMEFMEVIRCLSAAPHRFGLKALKPGKPTPLLGVARRPHFW